MASVQHGFDEAQIDLGLTGTRDTEQHIGRICPQARRQIRQYRGLACGQRRTGDVFCRDGRSGFDRTSLGRVGFAQPGRNRLQQGLAGRCLVVAGRKQTQRDPICGQGRQIAQHRFGGFELIWRRC